MINIFQEVNRQLNRLEVSLKQYIIRNKNMNLNQDTWSIIGWTNLELSK